MPRGTTRGAQRPPMVHNTMDRTTHVVFATGFSTAMLWGLDAPPGALFIVIPVAITASLIPDIDLHKAHRSLLHNIPVAVSLTLLAYAVALTSLPQVLAELVALGFLLGYTSHILLDMFTVRGVALLYPFSRRFYRLARLRSNDPLANKLLQALSAALAAYSAAAMMGLVPVKPTP